MRTLWLVAIALCLLDACRYGFTDWGVTHLKEVLDDSVSLAAFKYAVLPFGGIAGKKMADSCGESACETVAHFHPSWLGPGPERACVKRSACGAHIACVVVPLMCRTATIIALRSLSRQFSR